MDPDTPFQMDVFVVKRQWLEPIVMDITATGGAAFGTLAATLTEFVATHFGIAPTAAILAWYVTAVMPELVRDMEGVEERVLGHLGTPNAWDVLVAKFPRARGSTGTPSLVAVDPATQFERLVAQRNLGAVDELVARHGLGAPILSEWYTAQGEPREGTYGDLTLNGLLCTQRGPREREDRSRAKFHSAEFSAEWHEKCGRMRKGTAAVPVMALFDREAFSDEERAADAKDLASITANARKDIPLKVLLSVMTPEHRKVLDDALHRHFVHEDGGIVRFPAAWRAYLVDERCGGEWPQGFVPASLLVATQLENTSLARARVTAAAVARRERIYAAADEQGDLLRAMPALDPTLDPQLTAFGGEDRAFMAHLTDHLKRRAKRRTGKGLGTRNMAATGAGTPATPSPAQK